jgi:hypothetical protein
MGKHKAGFLNTGTELMRFTVSEDRMMYRRMAESELPAFL